MRRWRLLWQIYPSYLFITLLCVIVVGLYAIVTLRQFYIQQTADDLERLAKITQWQIGDRYQPHDAPYVDSICRKISAIGNIRLTVLLPDGTILGDAESGGAVARGGFTYDALEAISKKQVVTNRSADSLKIAHLFLTLPVIEKEVVIAVIRCGTATRHIDETMNLMYLRLGFGSLAIVLIVAVVSLFVARRISRPIEVIKRGAERFAAGELENALPVPGSVEIGSLAEVMNAMASQLSDRMQTVTQQRNEQEAILASMVEGVLAVDSDERLINLNKTAGTLIGIDPSLALGRSIHEVIRNSQLLQLIERIRNEQGAVEEQIVVTTENRGEQFLQANGAVLRDSRGESIGILIVLNDVTRIRNLENVRREFVANVSHELRTPLTSVKGYLETLLDGGVESQEDLQKFLTIMSRQVERLSAIIEDLLSLSSIEQQIERAQIVLTEESIREPLVQAIDNCKGIAQEKGVTLTLSCDPSLMGRISSSLIEQAVINLIENAVKYGPEHATVAIEALRRAGKIEISVTDSGPGIPSEHLGRIFERFYRIDRGRSRERGGTGLGLAIVKHIALAHGGTVEVESQLGRGSRFSILLPLP